jgi:hypothetical protein
VVEVEEIGWVGMLESGSAFIYGGEWLTDRDFN